jgi:hypothetical protein
MLPVLCSSDHSQILHYIKLDLAPNVKDADAALKHLRGLTPYEFIIKCWQNEPEWFRVNPFHHTLGLNI